MNLRLLWRVALGLGVAALFWLSRSPTPKGTAASPPTAGPVSGAPAPPRAPLVAHPEIGFRDGSHLSEHFQKHGAEFGVVSRAEYLQLAQALRDAPAGGDILQAVRQDGIVTRFDRRSGAFLASDPDLTIRTFFRPIEGEKYFDRQLKRGHSLQ